MFAVAGGQHPQGNDKKDNGAWVLYLLCVIQSNCIIPFLRTGFGNHALGARGLAALALAFICIGLERGCPMPGGIAVMPIWTAALVAALIVQRVITSRALAVGAPLHSMCDGRSLFMKLPFVHTQRFALFLEMMTCFVLGALLTSVSNFAGMFLMLGMLTLAFRTGLEDYVWQHRIERMKDARMEGRWYGDQMR